MLEGAWADFEPAVPVTASGFVWAAVGFFVLGGLVSLIRQSAGIARKRVRRRRNLGAAALPEPSPRRPHDGLRAIRSAILMRPSTFGSTVPAAAM